MASFEDQDARDAREERQRNRFTLPQDLGLYPVDEFGLRAYIPKARPAGFDSGDLADGREAELDAKIRDHIDDLAHEHDQMSSRIAQLTVLLRTDNGPDMDARIRTGLHEGSVLLVSIERDLAAGLLRLSGQWKPGTPFPLDFKPVASLVPKQWCAIVAPSPRRDGTPLVLIQPAAAAVVVPAKPTP